MEWYSKSSYRRSKQRQQGLILMLAIVVFSLVMLPAVALAGEAATEATNAAPAVNPWAAVIPAVVPILIMIAKMFTPNLPKVAIPIIAPVLGCLAAIALHYAGASVNPLLGAALGSAGVGLREIADQVGKTMSASKP